MKVVIAKKAGRITAVVVPNQPVAPLNSELEISCNIIAQKGISISEVDLPDDEIRGPEPIGQILEKLGVELGGRGEEKRVSKKKPSHR